MRFFTVHSCVFPYGVDRQPEEIFLCLRVYRLSSVSLLLMQSFEHCIGVMTL